MSTQAVTNAFPEYEHTQTGKLYLIFGPIVLFDLVLAWAFRHDLLAVALISGFALLMLLIGGMFHTLTIRDEGDALALRYGFIPGFRKRIPYARIIAVEPAKSTLLDGWGIHYGPREGWIWNLWGFDCVRLTLEKSTLRIGSDDVPNLVTFLKERVAENGAPAA